MRVAIGFACVLLALVSLWLWLRDSSLVAVKRVTVTGISGPDAPRVRDALEAAARDMTTMHVRRGDLDHAVEPFPAVLGLTTQSDLPHTLRITVRERNPVGTIVAAGQRVPVAADGTLMRTTRSDGLAEIPAKAPPAGTVATDRGVRRALALLAAAPPAVRARVRRVYVGPKGVTVPLRQGPTLYFGGTDRVRAKWAAATVVLADPTSNGASYIDLRLPERPAAGGLEAPPARAQGTGTTAAAPGISTTAGAAAAPVAGAGTTAGVSTATGAGPATTPAPQAQAATAPAVTSPQQSGIQATGAP